MESDDDLEMKNSKRVKQAKSSKTKKNVTRCGVTQKQIKKDGKNNKEPKLRKGFYAFLGVRLEYRGMWGERCITQIGLLGTGT